MNSTVSPMLRPICICTHPNASGTTVFTSASPLSGVKRSCYIVVISLTQKDLLLTDYRPVSVLSGLSEIFERVLRARLVSFLDRHQVINPVQYGFSAGHSTAMAVLEGIHM